ncbi:MAG: translation initiation factor IF-2 [Candidatus Geothermarchaeota archaeon]
MNKKDTLTVRAPILSVLGHVDSGKTTLLDKIRGTAVQLREAGGITQHIGASMLPKETLEAIAGDLLKKYRFEVRIPGLLLIDTPGHEVFTNLRKRGGSACDIAILVIDITKGLEPQTHESLNILLSREVPFVVAANKVDLLYEWRPQKTLSILESLNAQSKTAILQLEEKLSYIYAGLDAYKLQSNRFDRIRDFKKEVAVVPISAKTGEGIKELIAIIIGLVQKFMLDRLTVSYDDVGYGIVLEVSREHGIGSVLKCIHLDGTIRVGDTFITIGPEGINVGKVRGILLPAPLDEIRDPTKKFKSIKISYPAAGILIMGPAVENIFAGAPFYAITDEKEAPKYISNLTKEVSSIQIDTEKIGVIVKADTLGSLEALVSYITRKGMPVRKAFIGAVSKRDVIEAEIVKNVDETKGAIIAFNVDVLPDAEELAKSKKIPIFKGEVIFRLVDEYLSWMQQEVIRKRLEEYNSLTKPGKFQVLEGCVFRRSKPAIVGVKVLAGVIKPKYRIININNEIIGTIHQIQDKGNPIPEATRNMEVAISIPEAVVGRDFEVNEILYVDVPELDAKKLLKEFQDLMKGDERETLLELINIKRKFDPSWARG